MRQVSKKFKILVKNVLGGKKASLKNSMMKKSKTKIT